MTQAQVFNLLMAGLPSPQYVRDLNMDPAKNELSFTLKEMEFQVDCETLHVRKRQGNLISADFECDLLSQLLKKQKQISNA